MCFKILEPNTLLSAVKMKEAYSTKNFGIFQFDILRFEISMLTNNIFNRSPGSSVGQGLAYDLAVSSSIPAQGGIFSTVNWVPLLSAFHYQPLIFLI